MWDPATVHPVVGAIGAPLVLQVATGILFAVVAFFKFIVALCYDAGEIAAIFHKVPV